MVLKNLRLIGITLLFIGCRKEESTVSKFSLTNNSGVDLKIIYNKSKDTLKIKNNESNMYDRGWERGKSLGIISAFFAVGDSVVVIFNQQDTVRHYRNSQSNPEGKYYNIESNRNFYNQGSYNKEIEEVTKYERRVTLKYVFNTQDYLFAKE